MDTLINDVISVIAVRKESATKLKSDIKNNFFFHFTYFFMFSFSL